jgi:hypothetical protein
MPKQTLLFCIAGVLIVLIAWWAYRRSQEPRLDVEPHALKEIEKAKRR